METKQRLPLWLAVAITVMVGLPFGLWLGFDGGNFNLPLFIAFTVWAEYFAFGGKAKGLKTMIPAFLAGAVVALIVHAFSTWIANLMGNPTIRFPGDVGLAIGYFIGFCVAIYIMRFLPILEVGSLAYFQGIALALGCVFTGQGLAYVGNSGNVYLQIVGAGIACFLAFFLGCFLGWFNVTLNHAPEKEEVSAPAA